MQTTKIIPIVLLVIVLVVAGAAFKFYQDTTMLGQEIEMLSNEKAGLNEENKSLTYKYQDADRARKSVEAKLSSITAEFSRVEADVISWRTKYSAIEQERQLLVDKLRTQSSSEPKIKVTQNRVDAPRMDSSSGSDSYWQDFVRAKAELEVSLEQVKSELLKTEMELANVQRSNKELAIAVDDLTKKRDELDRDLSFKERTLSLVSKDLVNEREMRKKIAYDIGGLKKDNISLKRELLLANKEKLKLQGSVTNITEKKAELEKRISEIENIFKEKSLALQELHGQLNNAIADGKGVSIDDNAAIELPPIVVKPRASGAQGLSGEIIAVNKEEGFIVVDIGEVSGSRSGITLDIVRGGNKIGSAEVIETRRDISAADVKEVVSGFTIQEGDRAVSR